MRNHRYIWSIAIAAALAAGALAWLRQEPAPESAVRPSTDMLMAETLRMLEQDLQLESPATHSQLRMAAVAIERDRLDTAEAAFLLGRQYTREHNLPMAETQLRRATELDATWSLPWYELGALLARHTFGRAEEAEAALRQAITLDPDWARAHNTLAVLLRLEGRYEEAEESAKRALALAPAEVASHNNYANLLISLERFDEAELHYRKALELDPGRPKPYYNLACLYALMGRGESSLKYLETALDMAPSLREDAWNDPDLESLRGLPAFRQLVHGG